MTKSFTGYLQMHLELAVVRLLQVDIAAMILPLLGAVGVYVWYTMLCGLRSARWWLGSFFVVALTPLSLHIIASDAVRIWTYPQLVAFVALWGAASILPPRPLSEQLAPPSHRAFLWLLWATIALHIWLHVPLLEQPHEHLTRWTKLLLALPLLGLCAWEAATQRPDDANITPPNITPPNHT